MGANVLKWALHRKNASFRFRVHFLKSLPIVPNFILKNCSVQYMNLRRMVPWLATRLYKTHIVRYSVKVAPTLCSVRLCSTSVKTENGNFTPRLRTKTSTVKIYHGQIVQVRWVNGSLIAHLREDVVLI